MTVGRLARRGNAWAVVIPAAIRRDLNWWPGDDIAIVPDDGKLVLHNTTQHGVQMTKREKRFANTTDRRD